MRRWVEVEWSYCLHCLYHNKDLTQAIIIFQKRYNDRTLKAIRTKFDRAKIDIHIFCGAGIRKNKTPKIHYIEELKKIYKLVGRPFDKEHFTQASKIPYEYVIGYFGSWERALKEAGLLKKFEDFMQTKQEIKEFDPERELKQNWEKEKEKILIKAENRKIAWLREQSNKRDIINHMIKEAVAKAEPIFVEVNTIKVAKIQPQTKSVCTLWFEFSDLQLGTLLTQEEMGGLNRHNWIIWQEKLNIWKRHVIEKISFYRQTYLVERVVIACLGDMVEGNDIFQGQVWQVDTHVVDQAINGANDAGAAFIEIMLTHEDIHFDVLEVFGNHGRLGNKGEYPYSCSMDKVFQRMLQSQLMKVPNLKNYNYYENETWFYFVELYGWNHLLLHGDQGMNKLWSNRPTVNSLEKGLVRYNQIFQQQVHFLHCGHFHNDVTWSFNMSQILINGSFIGTSNFSASQLVAASPPVQILHVFMPRIGLHATERIYLMDGDIKNPLEPKKLIKK